MAFSARFVLWFQADNRTVASENVTCLDEAVQATAKRAETKSATPLPLIKVMGFDRESEPWLRVLQAEADAVKSGYRKDVFVKVPNRPTGYFLKQAVVVCVVEDRFDLWLGAEGAREVDLPDTFPS